VSDPSGRSSFQYPDLGSFDCNTGDLPDEITKAKKGKTKTEYGDVERKENT
jgi:hypothetical protein